MIFIASPANNQAIILIIMILRGNHYFLKEKSRGRDTTKEYFRSLYCLFTISSPFTFTTVLFKGKRLPQWLIKELLEQDRTNAKEEALRGKELTTGEVIVQPGESVRQFEARLSRK